MFLRLRHDALAGGDHKHRQIDSTRPGKHVAHKLLMPGNVDDVQCKTRSRRRLEITSRETEIDRDAAPLLLRQPICIDAGERSNQRSLAMVDMAGSAKHDGSLLTCSLLAGIVRVHSESSAATSRSSRESK